MITTQATPLRAGTYHDVMKHQFVDRRVIEPDIVGACVPDGANKICAKLEAEHDFVLLIFSRSKNLREAAARLASALEGPDTYLADRGDEQAALRHIHYSICRALAGLDYDSRAVGYITIASAFNAIA